MKTGKLLVFNMAALLLSAGILAGLELALRLIFPDLRDDCRRLRVLASQDADRKQSVIKEPDRFLMWKLKPGAPLMQSENLNRHGFRGPDFNVQKKPGVTRIACIGDSRTFGFGVPSESQTFCGRLRDFIASQKLNTGYEVLNLGTIGYSSFQGKRLMNALGWSLDPDMIIFWFGFNDSLFFHLTDPESAAQSPLIISTRNFLYRFAIFHQIRRSYVTLSRLPGQPVQLGQRIVRRVPLTDYQKILTELARSTAERNIRMVLLTSPLRPDIPLVLNAQRITEVREDGTPTERLQCQYVLDDYWLMDARRFPGTEPELDTLLIKYPELPILHYFKSQFLMDQAREQEAFEEIKTARELDTERDTIAQYNTVALNIAGNFPHVDGIDLVPLFRQYPDVPLFVDDCHPNANGHSLIAANLIEYLFKVKPAIEQSR
ncbi:SGNH/GDSL hydrolase family protein [bacterium]|nr:SGNH/GDSL hydrolase family protein [candidate division CSSED10-310 bacterium]